MKTNLAELKQNYLYGGEPGSTISYLHAAKYADALERRVAELERENVALVFESESQKLRLESLQKAEQRGARSAFEYAAKQFSNDEHRAQFVENMLQGWREAK